MGRTRTTNSSMFSNTSGEGKIRRHLIEADVVDCRVYHTRKELRPEDIQGIAGTYYADAAIVKLGKRLAAVLEEVRRSSPAWLSAELSRAWQRQWPDLPQSLDDAAAQPGPTEQELANLRVPTGVVGAVDDAVHPLTVAQQWAGASPAAALATVHLDELGANPGVLGAACVRSWRKASKCLSAG